MSSWDKYYDQKVTIPKLLSNLYGQKEFLAEIVNRAKGKVLEVGAGTGTMSIFLSWLGFQVVSIDKNVTVIERARQESTRFKGNVTFEVADTFKLPYSENSFSVVFHQGLLEHFSDSDIHKILDEQLRVAPIVVLSVPNHHYPKRDFGDERLMNKSQWEKILSKYKLIRSCYYSPKVFPKIYLPKTKIQYMAVIGRADE